MVNKVHIFYRLLNILQANFRKTFAAITRTAAYSCVIFLPFLKHDYYSIVFSAFAFQTTFWIFQKYFWLYRGKFLVSLVAFLNFSGRLQINSDVTLSLVTTIFIDQSVFFSISSLFSVLIILYVPYMHRIYAWVRAFLRGAATSRMGQLEKCTNNSNRK